MTTPRNKESTPTMVTIGDIYQKKNGRYAFMINAGVRPDGKPNRREITANKKNDLVKKRQKAMREIHTGTYISGATPTVQAWYTYWLDEIAAPRVRPNVLGNYRSFGRQHIIPTIGARKLDKLTVDDVRYMHTEMRRKGLSGRTVQAVHNTLSKCLKDAVREDKIMVNVCDKMDTPKADSRQREALSAAEVRALVNVIMGEPPMWRARWLMALHTGARQGECLGLEWDRVCLDVGAESVDLSWQVQRVPWKHGDGCTCGAGVSPARCHVREPDVPVGFELRPCHAGVWFQRPKTAASIRVTPITSVLAGAFAQWREETSGEGLVFQVGGRPILPRDDTAAWRELCARAGVRVVDLHSARHTMVTGLLEAGVDPEVIRQIVGHSTLVSTRHYLHVSQDQARAALAAWGG